MARAHRGGGLAVLLSSAVSLAAASRAPAPPPPPPPPPAVSAAPECFPTCRTGYFCHQGQCVSACNPPCGRGEVCTSTGQCVGGGSVPAVESVRAEGEGPAPAGFHYERKRRIGMLIGGVVPLGVGYFFSILYGVYSMATPYASGYYHGNGNLAMFVPILGPIVRQVVAISEPRYCNDPLGGTCAAGSSYWGVGVDLLLTLAFTAAQAVGLTFTLIGAVSTTQKLVRNGESARDSGDSGVRLSVAPMLAPGGAGITLVLQH